MSQTRRIEPDCGLCFDRGGIDGILNAEDAVHFVWEIGISQTKTALETKVVIAVQLVCG